MIRRTGFARRVYEPTPPAPLRPVERRGTYAGQVSLVLVPKDEPMRSEPYRRLVAARPCKACRIQGYSQAAHVPSDAKGMKQDDRETFPLCCIHPGPNGRLVDGCHVDFDRYRIYTAERAREVGRKWAAETRAEIEAEGNWPARLPRWEVT